MAFTSASTSSRARLTVALAFATLCGASCMDREGLQMGPRPGTGGGHGAGGAVGAGGQATGSGGSGWGGTMAGVGGAPSGAGGAPSGVGGATTGFGGTIGRRDAGPDVTGDRFTCNGICDIYCQWGNVVDPNGCPTCACNPPPACGSNECPPPPPYGLPICNGGMIVPPSCTRASDGKCAWQPPSCATTPVCSADECGPGPKTPTKICPDGSTAGPVCNRDASGKCGWTVTTCPPVICPAIDCTRACPYGMRKDVNGCDTCDCLPAGDCTAYGDAATCQADPRCTWLIPGCGTPALASQGCYARADIGCISADACSGGRTCLKRVVNPCPPSDGGATCTACGLVETICL